MEPPFLPRGKLPQKKPRQKSPCFQAKAELNHPTHLLIHKLLRHENWGLCRPFTDGGKGGVGMPALGGAVLEDFLDEWLDGGVLKENDPQAVGSIHMKHIGSMVADGIFLPTWKPTKSQPFYQAAMDPMGKHTSMSPSNVFCVIFNWYVVYRLVRTSSLNSFNMAIPVLVVPMYMLWIDIGQNDCKICKIRYCIKYVSILNTESTNLWL